MLRTFQLGCPNQPALSLAGMPERAQPPWLFPWQVNDLGATAGAVGE
jgi:hypothetical protein